MPIYEYRCRGCENEFEKLVIRSSQTIVCPHCEGEEIERVLSVFSHSSDGQFSSSHGASSSTCSSSGSA